MIQTHPAPAPTQTLPAMIAPTMTAPTMTAPTVKKMKWGEPTWFLFHTLAQKIKDESFAVVKTEFLNICFLICRNLPCPTCAEHATTYMQNIQFSRILTKQQLIDLFWNFHNYVNQRKNYAIFAHSDLVKYETAITHNIVQHFLDKFRDKNTSIRNIANSMFRERAFLQIQNWLHVNYHHFNE